MPRVKEESWDREADLELQQREKEARVKKRVEKGLKLLVYKLVLEDMNGRGFPVSGLIKKSQATCKSSK